MTLARQQPGSWPWSEIWGWAQWPGVRWPLLPPGSGIGSSLPLQASWWWWLFSYQLNRLCLFAKPQATQALLCPCRPHLCNGLAAATLSVPCFLLQAHLRRGWAIYPVWEGRILVQDSCEGVMTMAIEESGEPELHPKYSETAGSVAESPMHLHWGVPGTTPRLPLCREVS